MSKKAISKYEVNGSRKGPTLYDGSSSYMTVNSVNELTYYYCDNAFTLWYAVPQYAKFS